MIRGRKGQNFANPLDSRPSICVHCASLGEFEQGRPLIEALRAKYPNKRLVLTFFSSSGYDIRRNYTGVDNVYYLPFDTKSGAQRLVRQLHVEAFYFIKYEYWHNLLSELHRAGAKVFLVSAIFRADMPFFRPKWRGGVFFRSTLQCFSHLFVQNDVSKELLHGIGIDNVTVAGDTRFDRVANLTSEGRRVELVERFVEQGGGGFTVVCGSTWPPDEELLLSLMERHKEWLFVVAPHEISQERIDRLLARSGRICAKYSDGAIAAGATLFVVDTIGVLSVVYRYGQLAYIGGGFGVGIHNTLEAATWALPIVFGPKYKKFQEAVDLVELGAARSVGDAAELAGAMDYLHSTHKEAGAKAQNYVLQHIGATSVVMNYD